MKIQYNKIILLAILMLGLSNCTKDYESKPLDLTTQQYVFNPNDPNGTAADNFLTGIYINIQDRDDISTVPIDATTDDGVSSDQTAPIVTLAKVGYNPQVTFDDNMASMYNGIWKVNYFLANETIVPWSDPNKKVWYPAEARFLRAYFYYELIRRYGGVPLLGDKIFSLTDNMNTPRSTFDQCVAYIISECEAVKNVVRPEVALASRSSNVNLGRITNGIVMALEAKVYLLAASPLFNPNNDVSRWQLAATAAGNLVNSGLYQLEPNFLTPFITKGNKETIFPRDYGIQTIDMPRLYGPIGYSTGATTGINTELGEVSPTQELVDAFPDINGVDINTTGTVYNPAAPYANRDPRLNYTVFYNGQQWQSRAVQTFEGGLDKPNNQIKIQTQTGYYMRKFSADFSTAQVPSNQWRDWNIIRYADIMLCYAEALNEVSGPSTTVYQQLEAIRARAGIAKGANGFYGLNPTMSQAQMRQAIMNERRIELAFEDQRYFDLRRWQTAMQVYNKPLTAMVITQTSPGVFSYKRVQNVPAPYFSPRMYLYPFAQAEIQKNTLLVQNPGY